MAARFVWGRSIDVGIVTATHSGAGGRVLDRAPRPIAGSDVARSEWLRGWRFDCVLGVVGRRGGCRSA